MRAHGWRLLAHLALLSAFTALACYRPRIVDCVLQCATDGDCRGGMTCSQGLCTGGTTCALTVAAGDGHTCATIAGRIKCWGRNTSGQLGTSDLITYGDNRGEMGDRLPEVALGSVGVLRPTQDGQSNGQSTIAIGSSHTCVVLSDGHIKCWGDNRVGQLGLGDTRARFGEADLGEALPAVNLGAGPATAVTAGVYHTCALLSGGAIKCWGDNRFGQLGSGVPDNRGGTGDAMGDTLPAVDLGTTEPVLSVVAGAYHTCALVSGGAIKCWGWNEYGQLGLGDVRPRGLAATDMGRALPVAAVGTQRSARQIAAGAFHTCALLDEGAIVACWGLNTAGQLGLGDTALRGNTLSTVGDALSAVHLGSAGPARAVTAGANHTCILLNDYSVRCWGLNKDGELGIGTTDNQGDTPEETADRLPNVILSGDGSGPVSNVSAGATHTCAVQTGQIKCWGANRFGHLGIGDTVSRGDGHRPMAVVRLTGASD